MTDFLAHLYLTVLIPEFRATIRRIATATLEEADDLINANAAAASGIINMSLSTTRRTRACSRNKDTRARAAAPQITRRLRIIWRRRGRGARGEYDGNIFG